MEYEVITRDTIAGAQQSVSSQLTYRDNSNWLVQTIAASDPNRVGSYWARIGSRSVIFSGELGQVYVDHDEGPNSEDVGPVAGDRYLLPVLYRNPQAYEYKRFVRRGPTAEGRAAGANWALTKTEMLSCAENDRRKRPGCDRGQLTIAAVTDIELTADGIPVRITEHGANGEPPAFQLRGKPVVQPVAEIQLPYTQRQPNVKPTPPAGEYGIARRPNMT